MADSWPIVATTVLVISLWNAASVRAVIVKVAVPSTARFISLSIPAVLSITESGLPSAVPEPRPVYETVQLQLTTPTGSESRTRTPAAKVGPWFVTTTVKLRNPPPL